MRHRSPKSRISDVPRRPMSLKRWSSRGAQRPRRKGESQKRRETREEKQETKKGERWHGATPCRYSAFDLLCMGHPAGNSTRERQPSPNLPPLLSPLDTPATLQEYRAIDDDLQEQVIHPNPTRPLPLFSRPMFSGSWRVPISV